MSEKMNEGEIPKNLKDLLEHIPIIMPVDDDTEWATEHRRIKQLGVEGKCMCCEAPLGGNTVMMLKADGIHLLYCGGACMTDHVLTGWLEEVYEDLVQKIKFRGGQGDSVEEKGS